MRLITKLRLRLRSLFQDDAANRELDSELRFHLERQIAANLAAGMSPEAARAAALREFGGIDQIREECTDMRNVNWLQDFLQDLRYGIRTLSKSSGFAAIAIATLALGIGANTAIFSAVNTALLRTLPVTDPSSLVLLEWHAHSAVKHLSYSTDGDCVSSTHGDNPSGCSFSQPLFEQLRAQDSVFSGLTAFAEADAIDMSGNGAAMRVDRPEYVSGEYFETLGVQPASGRLITASDDTANASSVAVLSYAFWQTNFGGSPSAIGKTVLLNRVPFTIIGVAEPRFDARSPGNPTDLWVPLSTAHLLETPWDNRNVDPGDMWLVLVGRLKPGVSRSQAQAAISTMFRNNVTQGPKPLWKPDANAFLLLLPAQEGLTGYKTDLAAPLYLLMLAVGVVLLIACANVAGLLVSRAAARQKEFALRFALGARRGRIIRQLLTESLLLSIAGGAAGLLVARWIVSGMNALIAANTPDPTGATITLDLRVLSFTAGVSILTGILFGLAPAFRSIRVDLTPALKDANAGPLSLAYRTSRFSMADALVIAQVTLAMVILAGAGLLVRTLQNLKNIDPGFDTRNVLTFRIDPVLAGYTPPRIDSLLPDLQHRLASIPGVTSVTYSWRPLFGGGLWITAVHLPGTPEKATVDTDMLPVGPNFFQTMRIPLRLGREFAAVDFAQAQRFAVVRATEEARVAEALKTGNKGVADANKAALVGLPPAAAIVNEAFVRKYLHNQNPLGLRFGEHVPDESDAVGQPGWEIVGIVGDAKYNSLRRDIAPTTYVPSSGRSASYALRTAIAPANIVSQVRAVVSQVDKNLPIFRIRTESQQIDSLLLKERLIARLSGFFGILALVLACIGLYGLLSYEVSRRTREIGIRMALGAKARDVLRLVIGQGIILAGIGAVIGIAIAFGITRFLSSMLYNVTASDPLTFISVAILLGVVAALACYIPARRATRVDPLIALRYE